jgi:hypothetical protein
MLFVQNPTIIYSFFRKFTQIPTNVLLQFFNQAKM